VANLSITAAKITDPLSGASTCALNNHPVKGHKGVLIAKAKKKAQY